MWHTVQGRGFAQVSRTCTAHQALVKEQARQAGVAMLQINMGVRPRAQVHSQVLEGTFYNTCNATPGRANTHPSLNIVGMVLKVSSKSVRNMSQCADIPSAYARSPTMNAEW